MLGMIYYKCIDGLSSIKALAGKYRACMQLGWEGTEEPLFDGAYSRFYETAIWIFLSGKNEIKKLQKNISSELLASFWWQLTETEDIEAKLHKADLNWGDFSKEGDVCQEKMKNLYIFLEIFNEGTLQLYDVDNFLKEISWKRQAIK